MDDAMQARAEKPRHPSQVSLGISEQTAANARLTMALDGLEEALLPVLLPISEGPDSPTRLPSVVRDAASSYAESIRSNADETVGFVERIAGLVSRLDT